MCTKKHSSFQVGGNSKLKIFGFTWQVGVLEGIPITIAEMPLPNIKLVNMYGHLDNMIAVLLPLVLVALALPFVVMRAVMMELDCFVAHKKAVNLAARGDDCEHGDALTVGKMVRENALDKGLKSRIFVMLCCNTMGMRERIKKNHKMKLGKCPTPIGTCSFFVLIISIALAATATLSLG